MNKKTKLGQFYTTNYEYILQYFNIPDQITTIIEPFTGNGDLLKWIPMQNKYIIECYDIDPKTSDTIQRDTLLTPPTYTGKFVLTNPPYLARNKNGSKQVYDQYGCNDLYKCFIETIITDVCEGGIIIIPLNFISSIRTGDIQLRKRFMEKYWVQTINIFEEQVFDDTSYAVCSMQFIKRVGEIDEGVPIQCNIFPSKKQIAVLMNAQTNYSIGGEINMWTPSSRYTIERATSKTINEPAHITNILVKCIDDNINSKIQMKMVNDAERYIDTTDNLSARSYATLVISPALSLEKQRMLVSDFNVLLETTREKYNSLFLTNYRESNTIARKRISFALIFHLCSVILIHDKYQ